MKNSKTWSPATTTRTSRTSGMRTWSANERRERSLELADERRELSGGMRAIHFISVELAPLSKTLVTIEVDVTSVRDAWTRYAVRYDVATDQAFCTCEAAQRCAPCWHAGQVVLYGRAAADAYSPAACAATRREQYLDCASDDDDRLRQHAR